MKIDLSDFPAGRRLLADNGFAEDGIIGNNMPLVVEYLSDGYAGFFRARGNFWSNTFTKKYMGNIGPSDVLFETNGFHPQAGYMPLDRALTLVESGIAGFRQLRLMTPDFPPPDSAE